jgi:hypothetical protein
MKILLSLAVLTAASLIGHAQDISQTSSSSVYRQKVGALIERDSEAAARAQLRFERNPRLRTAQGDLLVGSASGIVRQRPEGIIEPFPARRVLPSTEINVLAEEEPNLYWIGTTRGAIRLDLRDGYETQYFSGRRWLAADQVTGIGFQTVGSSRRIWFDTPEGLSYVEYRPMTLAEKSRFFVDRIRARHVRHGYTADSRLSTPGDLNTSRPISTDNDGLWTAIYVAAECFRFRVTGDESARRFARQGIEALMRLEAITGRPGFPARSIIRIGVDEQPGDGEWHTTADGEWRWKGDTSSDEIVGHYFAYAVYYDLLADETERRRIREVVDRITSQIVDHGYQLIDVDGKRTRWGWWGPESIIEDPDETGLRALHILSHLRVALHITGNEKYARAYDDLVRAHHYHLLTRNQKINIPGRVNHSDDELAFLSYYPLLLYEKEARLKEIYVESLERAWQIERPERNPLWNFIYAAGTGAREFDANESIRTLREIPMDLISWTVENSHRHDLSLDPAADRFRRRQALTVLPYDELPVMKWNGNPYRLDGGNGGKSEDDGAFFLLPYWLGRYYRLIVE